MAADCIQRKCKTDAKTGEAIMDEKGMCYRDVVTFSLLPALHRANTLIDVRWFSAHLADLLAHANVVCACMRACCCYSLFICSSSPLASMLVATFASISCWSTPLPSCSRTRCGRLAVFACQSPIAVLVGG